MKKIISILLVTTMVVGLSTSVGAQCPNPPCGCRLEMSYQIISGQDQCSGTATATSVVVTPKAPSGWIIPETLVYGWSAVGFHGQTVITTATTHTWYNLPPVSIRLWVASVDIENGCSSDAYCLLTSSALGVNAGQSCGEVSAYAYGGKPPYKYKWSDGSSSSSMPWSYLGAGNYQVTVTDANGCTASTEVEVKKFSLTATVTTTPATCAPTGTATVKVEGTNPPYTYRWRGPKGFLQRYTDKITGLTPGTHRVTVTDANNCEVYASAVVGGSIATDTTYANEYVCTFAEVGVFKNTYKTKLGCDSVVINTRQLAPTSVIVLDSFVCKFSQTGRDTAIVQNSFGCDNMIITVRQLAPSIKIEAETGNVICNGDANGFVDLNVSGGTAPFRYKWSTNNKDTIPAIFDLSGGFYAVTVTDDNGCTATRSFVLTEPAPITVTVDTINPSCLGNDGRIAVTPSGGTPGYTFAWANSPNKQPVYTGLPSGEYNVTVTDANGCTSDTSFVLLEPTGCEPATATCDVIVTRSNQTVTVNILKPTITVEEEELQVANWSWTLLPVNSAGQALQGQWQGGAQTRTIQTLWTASMYPVLRLRLLATTTDGKVFIILPPGSDPSRTSWWGICE